jgi:signal transduction histidine kinase
MARNNFYLLSWAAELLPWLTLFLLLVFLYAKLFVIPYTGFHLTSEGEIVTVFTEERSPLDAGDFITQVNGTAWDTLRADPWRRLFPDVVKGSILNLTILNGGEGEPIDVAWRAPGLNFAELADRLNSQWWMAFIFWGAGTAAWFLIRPRDSLWWLFLLFNYVTGLWLITGGVALWKVWLSAPVFHSSLWLCLPIYLHFHWNFPSPLRRIPPLFWAVLYLAALVGAIGEWLPLWPGGLYYFPFLAALAGMILPLIARAIWRPAERPEMRLLFLTTLLSVLPAILVSIVRSAGLPLPAYLEGGAILALAAIPGAYFYTLYRRQYGQLPGRAGRLLRLYLALTVVTLLALLVITVTADRAGLFNSVAVITFILTLSLILVALFGFAPIVLLASLGNIPGRPGRSLELRANRQLTAFFFFPLLLAAAALPAFGAQLLSPGAAGVVALLTVLAATFITWGGYSHFARFVESKVLGMPLPPAGLVETYAGRIATSLERESLIHLLCDGILPTLLVRQSALLFWDETHPVTLVYSQGIEKDALMPLPSAVRLSAQHEPHHPVGLGAAYEWARLALPLSLNQQPVGLWLLGRRDPDDTYGAADITTFQALANQTAVALVNILQAENLQTLYQVNIEREEKERLGLAHELHDDVLNELAAMLMYVEQTSPQFDQAYQTLVERLRGMIRGLRPPMLDMGLFAALDSLLDDLLDRVAGETEIRFEVPESAARYDAHVEQYLFRIIHQAAENALRHAQARTIYILGSLEPERIHLEVVDDGRGFVIEERPNLAALLAEAHYGLAGMYERAALIGATLTIQSTPGKGSLIAVTWQPDEPHE